VLQRLGGAALYRNAPRVRYARRMAGTYVQLCFSDRAVDGLALVSALQAFARERMVLERVQRLQGHQPVFGQHPADWQASGVTPADLGLEDDAWHLDVVDRDAERTLEAALRRWPLGPWSGLCVQYRLPCGEGGFPAIVGSCWWRIWAGTDGTWRHRASIEYPFSSVGHDPRWAGWVGAFASAAEAAFGGRCTRG